MEVWRIMTSRSIARVLCFLGLTLFLDLQPAFAIVDLDVGRVAPFQNQSSHSEIALRCRIDLFSISSIPNSEPGQMTYLSLATRYDVLGKSYFCPVGVNFGWGEHGYGVPVRMFESGLWAKTANFTDWVPEISLSAKIVLASVSMAMDWNPKTSTSTIGIFIGFTLASDFSATSLLFRSKETL